MVYSNFHQLFYPWQITQSIMEKPSYNQSTQHYILKNTLA